MVRISTVMMQEPAFAPWDGRRVPVTLLAGYLGSGKTTIINELLARTTQPIAVLVNDVGEVNIDAALIKRQTGDTIELTDGCVCCSMINGFVAAFDQLRERETPPAHVIVELSGVAEPARAAPWAGTIGFRLDGIVVVVDAEQFVTWAEDPWVGELVRNQVTSADLLILSKTDIASPASAETARDLAQSLAPHAPLLASGPGATAAILELAADRHGGMADLPSSSLFDAHETELIPLPPLSQAELEHLVGLLPASTLRAKGIAADHDGKRWLVQVVGSRSSITPLPPAEDQPPTPLVVIRRAGTASIGSALTEHLPA